MFKKLILQLRIIKIEFKTAKMGLIFIDIAVLFRLLTEKI